MARIRTIKPEFFTSEDVCELDPLVTTKPAELVTTISSGPVVCPCATVKVVTEGVRVKLVVALTTAAEGVAEVRFVPSPLYDAVTLFLPSGRLVVE